MKKVDGFMRSGALGSVDELSEAASPQPGVKGEEEEQTRHGQSSLQTIPPLLVGTEREKERERQRQRHKGVAKIVRVGEVRRKNLARRQGREIGGGSLQLSPGAQIQPHRQRVGRQGDLADKLEDCLQTYAMLFLCLIVFVIV